MGFGKMATRRIECDGETQLVYLKAGWCTADGKHVVVGNSRGQVAGALGQLRICGCAECLKELHSQMEANHGG